MIGTEHSDKKLPVLYSFFVLSGILLLVVLAT